MDAKQTLFSLELAVDSICLVPHTLVCRMPAVAFRLLDFPPLMIQQLDLEETKQLRQAMQGVWDADRKVPNQFGELKNRHGNYEFKKGKSSLYNYELDLLETHLTKTPLYVMILDVWNEEVPKLVGHCNISLKDVVSFVKRDVEEFGLSVPSVHGTQGKFPVFNLMGSEIGWISLGIRLLSLGGNLTPHIPVEAVSVRKESDRTIHVPLRESNLNVVQERIPVHEAQVVEPITLKKDAEKARDGVKEVASRETAKDWVSVATETEFSSPYQTEKDESPLHNVKSRSTTSASSRSTISKTRQRADKLYEHSQTIMDDMFVTNVHVPPPLFFNSKNEVQEKQQKAVHARGSRGAQYFTEDSHYVNVPSQMDTEDVLSPLFEERKELEVQYIIHPPEFHSSPNVRKILRKKQDKSRTKMQIDADGIDEKENRDKEVRSMDNHNADLPTGHTGLEHLRRLPILNALLQELSLLHGGNIQDNHHHFQQHQTSRREQSLVDAQLKTERVGKRKGVGVHKTETDVESKPQPPAPQKVYRHKHKECAQPPAGVPATKGWLRQEPVYGKSHSSSAKKPKQAKQLKFKMTHSQKLRLQRHNPEALRQVQEEERIAEIEFQIRAAQMHMNSKSTPRGRGPKTSGKTRPSPALRPSENMVHLPDAVVSTEISRHQDDDPEDLTAGLTDDADFKIGTETFKIPLSGSERDEQEQHQDQLPDVPDQLKNPRDSPHQDLSEKDVSGSEKSIVSISVRLPSAMEQREDGGDEDAAEESLSSDDSQDEGPKVVPFPGFPADDHKDENTAEEGVTPRPVPSSQGMYSEDFDDSYNFQSTGEQELASFRSSDRSARSSSETSFNRNRDRLTTATPPMDSSRSGSSRESSYETADSVKSASSIKAKREDGAITGSAKPSIKINSESSSSTSSRNPTARLAIPQPQISANSPVPLARRSSSKSVAFKDQESNNQPTNPKLRPEPKPRLSLDQTASSISNASILAPDLTLSRESTDVNTSDLKPGYSDDDSVADDVYSDDFDSGDN